MLNLIAQQPLDLGDAIKIDGTRAIRDVYPDLGSLINLVVFNLFILAGIIFLFLLIGGGFSIIAGGTSKGIEEGQQKVTTAVIGLLVMFSAYWIIQIVELVTGLVIL